MLKELLKMKRFPSPLLIEGENALSDLKLVVGYALCQEQKNCGICSSCKKIQKGFHPDWLQMSGEVKMEELRELLFQLRQRPLESKMRVFSITAFDAASIPVQNALLKTFEEPLPHWILVASLKSRFSILETIRSRALVFRSSLGSPQDLSFSSPQIAKVFEAGVGSDQLQLSLGGESFLKDRASTRKAFVELLEKASSQNYPGLWLDLAEPMEEGILELDRNLNQKIVWDRVLARARFSQAESRA